MLATSLDLRIALTKKNTGTILLLMSILLKPVQAPPHATVLVSILEMAAAHVARVVDVLPKVTKSPYPFNWIRGFRFAKRLTGLSPRVDKHLQQSLQLTNFL